MCSETATYEGFGSAFGLHCERFVQKNSIVLMKVSFQFLNYQFYGLEVFKSIPIYFHNKVIVS